MKRIVLLLSLLLIVPFTLARAADGPQVVTADYLIGMLKAGMSEDDIIEHVINEDLTFRLEKGDIDRLREAGAGKDLIRVVTRREVGEDEGYGMVLPYYGVAPYYYPGYVVAPWSFGYYSYYYPRYGYRLYPYHSHHRYYGRHSITPRGGTGPRVVPRGSGRSAPSTGRGQTHRPPRGSH